MMMMMMRWTLGFDEICYRGHIRDPWDVGGDRVSGQSESQNQSDGSVVGSRPSRQKATTSSKQSRVQWNQAAAASQSQSQEVGLV